MANARAIIVGPRWLSRMLCSALLFQVITTPVGAALFAGGALLLLPPPQPFKSRHVASADRNFHALAFRILNIEVHPLRARPVLSSADTRHCLHGRDRLTLC